MFTSHSVPWGMITILEKIDPLPFVGVENPLPPPTHLPPPPRPAPFLQNYSGLVVCFYNEGYGLGT